MVIFHCLLLLPPFSCGSTAAVFETDALLQEDFRKPETRPNKKCARLYLDQKISASEKRIRVHWAAGRAVASNSYSPNGSEPSGLSEFDKKTRRVSIIFPTKKRIVQKKNKSVLVNTFVNAGQNDDGCRRFPRVRTMRVQLC